MAKRNCAACGSKVPVGRLFCGSCGAAMMPAEPKKPMSKKTIGAIIGAVVGVAALVGAYLVFFPAPLNSKDVRISLNIPVASDFWAGAKVDVSSKVTFYAKRDAEYKVVIESQNVTSSDWSELTSTTGKYPAIDISQSLEALPGETAFRVLVYLADEPKPIAIGKQQSIFAKQAHLPDNCPVDEINHAWGTTETDTMELFGQSTAGNLDCTIGAPNSDYIVPIKYFESDAKKFAALKKSKHGKAIKLNLGETGAFKYWIPANEIGGAYWAYVINFHDILIDTELQQSNLGILVDAIVIDDGHGPMDNN